MKKFTTLILLLTVSVLTFAQNKYTIKGKVIDETNQEWLVGVAVGVKELPQNGSFTDDKGNYEISLPQGEYTLVFALLGFDSKEAKIKLTKNQKKDVFLSPGAYSLNEVEITAIRRDENIRNVQMGVEKLQIETVNKIPVLLGEKDILKTLQLLPGVQSPGEGNVGFYVRGGTNDQNLILLDGATVYNPSHLMGFFSTFNSDAVDNMSLYKGSMPVQYGGRLSSTLDVGMRDGDMEKMVMTGGIGLISSRLTLEGPIQSNKSSFIVSGRRTYADLLGKAAGVEQVKNSSLYFYDLNAKMSYVLSPKDKITLSTYYGKDLMSLDNIVGIDWGNTVASLKWNHTPSEKMILSTALTFTDYTYNVRVDLTTGLRIKSKIRDYNLSHETAFFPNEKHTIRVGVNSTYHKVIPGELSSTDENQLIVTPFEHRYSWANAVFASHQIQVTDRVEASYGLRVSSFSVLGGGDFHKYDDNQEVTETFSTKKNSFVKTYWALEPRLSLAYQLNESSSVKAAYTRMTQNMHLMSSGNMSSPTDRWLASTNYIRPEIADQVSLGYFRNFADNMFEFSAEAYYKKMQNQIDYKDGANTFDKDNVETELLFGRGRSYGLELYVKKKHGRFTGWVGYTLSRTQKQIEKINDGEWYASSQDRRHDISIVGMYDLTSKWSLSATWVYGSGAPMSFPNGKYIVDNHVVYYYEGRNKYRTPAFHRLDLGANCILMKTKSYTSELSFSLYNAYGQQNPYMYGYRLNKDDNTKTEAYMIYLFSIIPSVTWNFKF